MTKKSIVIEQGKRLQNLRKKTGLTRHAFAAQTGMSEHTLKALELGDRELTPQKALLFSNLFVSLYSVSLGEDSHEASFDYLFYGKNKTSSEQKGAFIHDNDDVYMQNEINFFATNSAYSILKIRDDLMSPLYNVGDIIAGKKVTNKKLFLHYLGHICIIESLGGDKFLRRIIKCDGQKVTVCLLNTKSNQSADFVEEIEALSIAQTLWHWHLSEVVRLPSTR